MRLAKLSSKPWVIREPDRRHLRLNARGSSWLLIPQRQPQSSPPRSRQTPTCDVEIGHRTATACHVGNIARWLGRKLRWDPVNETFLGDDEANAMLSQPMREPWHL